MFDIKNARVSLYKNKEISSIDANFCDQDYDTIMRLGRGKMYDTVPAMVLKYNLPNGVIVSLWMW